MTSKTKCARYWKAYFTLYDRHVCTGGSYCKGDCKSDGQLVDASGKWKKATR